jgi:hypothetical protein
MDTAAPDVEADGGGCFVAMDSRGATGGGSTEGAGEAARGQSRLQSNRGFSVWEPNSLPRGRLPEDRSRAGDPEVTTAACVGWPMPPRRLWERGESYAPTRSALAPRRTPPRVVWAGPLEPTWSGLYFWFFFSFLCFLFQFNFFVFLSQHFFKCSDLIFSFKFSNLFEYEIRSNFYFRSKFEIRLNYEIHSKFEIRLNSHFCSNLSFGQNRFLFKFRNSFKLDFHSNF